MSFWSTITPMAMTEALRIRIDADDLDQLRACAERRRIPMASWAREHLMAAAETENAAKEKPRG